jgi:membrane associated rhomboid family serine protease
MLIPYNVDRPARRLPWVTYTLIGINVFVFFITILIANVNLPSNRLLAQQDQIQLFQTALSPDSDEGKAVAAIQAVYPNILPVSPVNPDSSAGDNGDNLAPTITAEQQQMQQEVRSELSYDKAKQLIQNISQKLAMQQIAQPGGYDRFWRIQHMHDTVVWEPDYSTLNWMAYHPNEQSPWWKLLGLFGSMFLHGGIEHIAGNMFFLWIFGRAVEDALGWPAYIGAYLLCGVAAALMQHIMTLTFTPSYLSVPLLGASGAIAGVMGLFAPRFYRTPVRTFYVLPYAIPVIVIATSIVGGVLYLILGDLITSLFLGFVAAAACMYFFGRTWCWGIFKAPAAWWLAFYIIIFNVLPGLWSLNSSGGGGGVAHWAHIGGFAMGILYAFMIGFPDEGKKEFGLEDAEKYYEQGDHLHAAAHAQTLVDSSAEQAPALEVLGKSLAAQKKGEEASEAFRKSIALYLKKGERTNAIRVYLVAVNFDQAFVLPVSQQLAVGSAMESKGDFQDASKALIRMLNTYPNAPESEVALLRCARIYLDHLGHIDQAQMLLAQFRERFPHSNWMEQAQKLNAKAQNMAQLKK